MSTPNDRDGCVCYAPDLINDFADRKPITSTQIEDAAAPTTLDPLQAQNMSVKKVAHVNVFADTGPIWCFVVSTKDYQRVPFEVHRMSDKRN